MQVLGRPKWSTRALGLALGALAFMTAAAGPAASADKTVAPTVLPRSAWTAQAPDTALMVRQQRPRAIVIHHTAEQQQPQQSLEEKLQKLLKFSRSPGKVGATPKRAWGDVPYHFYIDSAGRVGEGRSLAYAGDSNTSYDVANRIQIVLEGNFTQERPSASQLKALDQLVVWLASRYRIPATGIAGHNDHVATTECPGLHLKSYLPALRAKVAAATARW
jgi:N-acetyl-anhydromuramyl-L-alanine amidase AmpD